MSTIDPRDLARAIAQVIAERNGKRGRAHRAGSGGYHGVSGIGAVLEEELEDQLLDGRDDLVAICREALARLRP
jgi:hypothetical protein